MVNHINTFFSNLDDNYYKNVQCGRFLNLLYRLEVIAGAAESLSHFGNAGVD